MGLRAAVKAGQTAHRIEHAFGVGRIALGLNNLAAKAGHAAAELLQQHLTIWAFRHQRAKPRQPLRDALNNHSVNIVFWQKPHEPDILRARRAVIGKCQCRNIAADQHRPDGPHRIREKRPDNNIGLSRHRLFGGMFGALRRAFRVVQANNNIRLTGVKHRQLGGVEQISRQCPYIVAGVGHWQ